MGDGSTTFNIPDLRGYFVRGWADTGSIDAGRVLGSTQTDQFQTHTHTVTDPGHQHLDSATNVGGAGAGGNTYAEVFSGAATGVATTGLTVTGPNTGRYGSETRPVNIALMKVIRVQ